MKYKSFQTILAGLTFVIGTISANVATTFAATTAELYGSPTHVSASAGRQYRVAVHLNTEGASVDTVNVVVHYQAAYATFVGLDNAGAAFDATVPATPTARNGEVTFSKARLGNGPAKGDVVVSTLIFSANTSNGSDTVRFDGSQIAHNGAVLALRTTPVPVTYSQSTSASAGPIISGIHVSNVSVNGGTIEWRTDVPATSSVDYGVTTKYGLNAGDNQLVTDHKAALDKLFAGKSVVYYRVTSTDANAQSTQSAGQSFTTTGYTVHIQVTGKNGKSVNGVQVKVAALPAVTTDSKGSATISNVSPGNQKVVIGDNSTQFITVQSTRGAQATKIQDFTLSTSVQQPVYWYFLVPLLLAALALLWVVSRRSSRTNS